MSAKYDGVHLICRDVFSFIDRMRVYFYVPKYWLNFIEKPNEVVDHVLLKIDIYRPNAFYKHYLVLFAENEDGSLAKQAQYPFPLVDWELTELAELPLSRPPIDMKYSMNAIEVENQDLKAMYRAYLQSAI